MSIHERYIKKAYHLARLAMDQGEQPFSALLTINDEVLFECINRVNSSGDLTRHPEIDVLRRGSLELGREKLKKATLYASSEPCAMCGGALYWSGISRLVFGCPTETIAAIAGARLVVPCRELFAKGRRSIELIGPVLPETGAAIHQAYWDAQSGQQ